MDAIFYLYFQKGPFTRIFWLVGTWGSKCILLREQRRAYILLKCLKRLPLSNTMKMINLKSKLNFSNLFHIKVYSWSMLDLYFIYLWQSFCDVIDIIHINENEYKLARSVKNILTYKVTLTCSLQAKFSKISIWKSNI